MVDIIHCLIFYLKYDISETAFCLHVELTDFGPVERDSLSSDTNRITKRI
jgi:hypothetical protein